MKTARDWAELVPARVGGYTRGQWTHAVRTILRKNGIPYGNATYDEAKNCNVCGEAGRCPGVHTLEELNSRRQELLS